MKDCYSHCSGAGVETKPLTGEAEHTLVRSKLTGRNHEVQFSPLPAHSDPSNGGNIVFNPYKSKSQMRAFFAKESRGELPKGTAEHWAHETPNLKHLPEKVKK